MSTSGGKRVASVGKGVRYQMLGKAGSKQRGDHLRAGTDRAAALRCDAGSPEEFIALAEGIAERTGRQTQGWSYIQSFSKDEMDPSNPDDVRRANDLGYLLAKERHPNAPALSITHTDGETGCVHNHITSINHDTETGRALDADGRHWVIHAANDRVMQERGHDVAQRGVRRGQAEVWAERKGERGARGQTAVLRQAIDTALADPRSTDEDAYREVLQEHGVTLTAKDYRIGRPDEQGRHRISRGWTYSAELEDGTEVRRKASALGPEYTHKGTAATLEKHREKQQSRQTSTATRQRLLDRRRDQVDRGRDRGRSATEGR